MNWEEIISAISAIIVAIAAVVAAGLAKKGLDTWRQQMKGKDEYKLSRNLLASLYKYRDAVFDVRRPSLYIPVSDKDIKKDMTKATDEQKSKTFNAVRQEYQRKWDIVIKQQHHIYGYLVVAKALWGDELYVLFRKLFGQADILRDATRWMLRLINPDIPKEQAVNINNPEASHREYATMRSIVFLEKGNDVFGEQIMQDINPIEQYLKQKLEMTLKS